MRAANGRAVAHGQVNGDEVVLPSGRYTLRFDGADLPDVAALVKSGELTALKVAAGP